MARLWPRTIRRLSAFFARRQFLQTRFGLGSIGYHSQGDEHRGARSLTIRRTSCLDTVSDRDFGGHHTNVRNPERFRRYYTNPACRTLWPARTRSRVGQCECDRLCNVSINSMTLLTLRQFSAALAFFGSPTTRASVSLTKLTLVSSWRILWLTC